MTTPTGGMGLSLHHLRAMLAASTTFRTWVGAVDSTAALARIYLEALPPPADLGIFTPEELSTMRPFAIASLAPEQPYRRTKVAGGNPFTFAEAGTCLLQFEDDVPAELKGKEGEALVRFENILDGIISDLSLAAGVAGFLAINEIVMRTAPELAHEDAESGQGSWAGAAMVISWGPQ